MDNSPENPELVNKLLQASEGLKRVAEISGRFAEYNQPSLTPLQKTVHIAGIVLDKPSAHSVSLSRRHEYTREASRVTGQTGAVLGRFASKYALQGALIADLSISKASDFKETFANYKHAAKNIGSVIVGRLSGLAYSSVRSTEQDEFITSSV